AAAPAPAPRIAVPPRPASPPPAAVRKQAPPPIATAPSRPAPAARTVAPKAEPPVKAAAPKTAPSPQQPSVTQAPAPALAPAQARQQLRELQAKQRDELRAKNLKPAERQQLRAKQRDELRDLQAKQREQRNVASDTLQTSPLKNDAQTRLQERQQVRDLLAKQRQELRNKKLSPAERRGLIARQHDELRALRAEQTSKRLGTQQAQQPAQDKLQTQQQTQQSSKRTDAPITADIAKSGRFAAAYQNDPNWQARRAARLAARQAWRQGRRAAFVAWVGPVFYPYAYSDIFEYTFWPYAYDDAYWAYVYDDFVDSIFWAEASPYSDYAYYGPSPRSYSTTTGSAPSRSPAPSRSASVAQICSDPGKGITSWPFTQIEQAVRPNADQRRLLQDLKHAAAEAAETFKASCGDNFPLTPSGRLAAMTNRLEATLQAVRTVRPALEAFYSSLSDEQTARFTAIGPDHIGADRAKVARSGGQQDAKVCTGQKQGLTDLPIERIEDAIRPTPAQQEALERLKDATAKAVERLASACPDFTPLTPVGRLEAMDKRLAAMVEAGKTVQPALEQFYASLSNEQKAHFNTLGQQTARQ
ncbi:Spy/CpxP family protein refolding chaperone, partial [Methyloceanibacter sp.]|uniref:Spy/CpxP family protein refolding chaperone n=1 Tax=Methyloceanibacter sp. TaxID=1965321 RepID=UPI00351AC1EC